MIITVNSLLTKKCYGFVYRSLFMSTSLDALKLVDFFPKVDHSQVLIEGCLTPLLFVHQLTLDLEELRGFT